MPNNNIQIYNNIWSDPTGSMGSSFGGANDFSDTPSGETTGWMLDNNLYWNGLNAIPEDNSELINYTDDINRVIANPTLPSTTNIVLPRWNPANQEFADGSITIEQAFIALVDNYGVFSENGPAKDAANSNFSPQGDILGNIRTTPDIGAVELISTCDMVPTNQWIGANGDWHQTTSNWSLNRFPEPCDAVLFPAGVIVTISNGNIGQGYTLDVPSSSVLETQGTGELIIRNPGS